jgi:hypothetical protein
MSSIFASRIEHPEHLKRSCSDNTTYSAIEIIRHYINYISSTAVLMQPLKVFVSADDLSKESTTPLSNGSSIPSMDVKLTLLWHVHFCLPPVLRFRRPFGLVCVNVCVSVSPSLCLSISVCLSVCLFDYLSPVSRLSVSVCLLSVSVCLYLSLSVSVCLRLR